MKGITTWIVLGSLLLSGCDQKSIHKDAPMNPLTDINARLAFTCKHQIIPEASADTDVLFKYARWLQKNNLINRDKMVDAEIARLYRIAAENGHYKASINLQNGALRGRFSLSSHERLRLSQQLIDAKVAAGYYFIAIYLEHGAAGLAQDPEMALRYYRKAADEGNPQAQAFLGEKLFPAKRAPQVAMQMFRCAALQGEGKAANSLGNMLAIYKKYPEAVEVFQLGVAAGDSTSAGFLMHGFSGPEPTDRLFYLALEKDPERARRYEQIGAVLAKYSWAHPVVPEINDIVPLPPAPLPEWDGKLKWLEEWEANIPPPVPDAALIEKLAQAKQLNPATGRPLPTSPDFEKDSVARLQCRSGEPCPQSGYWQPAWRPREGMSERAIRFFREGDIIPLDKKNLVRLRSCSLRDK
ncbi:SEL1-like repeat protein [Klebsiella pneumoniae]|uniref:SEL1-like repeat protein n=2 Tax=Klebsiella pneumoniae TaxID=573 RepID=UPI000C7BFBBA|nr:sel1 repeat family protein [Klebsiella pneumoniae]EIX9452022.1 sel1 repeat family protein [Klebsiella pneumoniae]KAB1528235.1 sel1 repeat family protein [Klebsiella pneumoniae]MBD1358681.1 sel1 repeat family protein [Klebsiella pneumoniae]MBS2070752.1 sel1 repeat family protein [Klebsiella pneumoniae]MCJ3357083.1 sel1 repeat family protein [Klebsiella pneumoniae]